MTNYSELCQTIVAPIILGRVGRSLSDSSGGQQRLWENSDS